MKLLSMKQFGQIVADVMHELPPDFLPYLENVVVDIDTEPSEEILRRAGLTEEEIAAGESLLGFYDPEPLPTFGWDNSEAIMHRIWIFKRPHEDEFPNPEELRRQIRKTVIHEVAHRFGLSDEDLARWTTVY